MACDAVIVSVADYPFSNRLFRALPGAARDHQRLHSWLSTHTQNVKIEDFAWPPKPPVNPQPDPWTRQRIEATMQELLLSGLRKTRQRLFFYASGHGMSVPSSPAMPAVYCASHWSSMYSDLFLSSGWVPQFTAAPVYDEYLCFFDCCNDWQPGQLPVFQSLNLPLREDSPRVLVMAACKPGQQALDTPTGGVFTDVLLEALSGSAGSPGSTDITAADVVAYLKENVPIRAAQLKQGHIQTPVEWVDPNSHANLSDFVLRQRQPVSDTDVTALLAAHAATDVTVLGSDLQPVGALQAGPDNTASLPPLLPGKYVLRSNTDDWKLAIRLKTTVTDDGNVVAKAEALNA